MEMALEVAVLLDGCQLYVITLITVFSFPPLSDKPLRLRKKQLSPGRQAMSTSSVLFGINHSMSCWIQFMSSLKLDTSLNVQMELSVTSIQLF